MTRCPNGSRKNKDGKCVKTHNSTKKRCPNGSRKNKNGNCVKKQNFSKSNLKPKKDKIDKKLKQSGKSHKSSKSTSSKSKMADNSQCDWSILTKKNSLAVKRQLKEEISQLKQEIKEQKLTKEEKKAKSEYEEEVYWMSMCEGMGAEGKKQEEEYLKYLNLMLEKKTGKSDVNYFRLVELEKMLSELN